MSNINKKAALRTDDDCQCPFGLSISAGSCRLVGDIINKMAPLNILGDQSSDEEIEELSKANHYLYKWQCPGTKCIFAGAIFLGEDGKTDETVQCTWGEDGLGDGSAIVGSPYYWNHFSGIGMDGLYSFPLGFYSQAPVTPFYGSYSLENPHASEDYKENIKK